MFYSIFYPPSASKNKNRPNHVKCVTNPTYSKSLYAPNIVKLFHLSKKSSSTLDFFFKMKYNKRNQKTVKRIPKQERKNKSQIKFSCVEELISQDHLLRKIDSA